jgi:hypothetical protein
MRTTSASQQQQQQQSTTSRRGRTRKPIVATTPDDDEDDEEEQQPSTSQQQVPPLSNRKLDNNGTLTKRGAKGTTASKSRTDLDSFPDWMLSSEVRKFPYIAQIGDRVVYFRQGHDNYVSAVENSHLYVVSAKCRPRNELDAEEFAIVDDIKYTLHPYRLICVKLAQTDDRDRRTGYTFTVR